MPTRFSHNPLFIEALAPLQRLLAGIDGAFVVGGSLRDLAMGRTPGDVDIAVTGDSARAARRLARRVGGRPVRLGRDDLYIHRVTAGGRTFDIAPALGGSMAADLARRDFTVNAMAWDLDAGVLMDPYGGMADLAAGTLRAVCESVFRADPVRMLRAFRLCADLGFCVDAPTEARISADAHRIGQSAGERIHAELFKLFGAPVSADAVIRMSRYGLLQRIFPELCPLAGCAQGPPHDADVLAHTLSAYGHLETLLAHGFDESGGPEQSTVEASTRLNPDRRALLKCAMLLHDIGKPASRTEAPDGRIHFHGHGRIGARLAVHAANRLKFSNHQRRSVEFLIGQHLRPLSLFLAHRQGQLTRRGLARFFRTCHPRVPDLLLHAAADMRAKAVDGKDRAAFEAFVRQLLDCDLPEFCSLKKQPPLITGHDLMESLGLPPSPALGRILSKVEQARLSGEVQRRDQALELARRLRESIS